MLKFDLWVPATLAPTLLAGSRELDDRGQRGYNVAGRLAPRRTRRRRRRPSSTSAMSQLAHDYPETNARRHAARCCRSGRRRAGRSSCSSAALAMLQGVMLLLLLAVCGNTANLMLARASARHREIGVRLALGAGPWRIVSLLLTENLLLALLGAALGAAIAVWATERAARGADDRRVPDQIPDEHRRRRARLRDRRSGLLCGLIFGIAPARPARTRRSAGGAPLGRADGRAQPRCATR